MPPVTAKEALETLAKNVTDTVVKSVKERGGISTYDLEAILKDAFDNHIPPIVASWTFHF